MNDLSLLLVSTAREFAFTYFLNGRHESVLQGIYHISMPIKSIALLESSSDIWSQIDHSLPQA